MKKDNILLVGHDCMNHVFALMSNHKVEVINDIPTTEPFYLTNPYKDLPILSSEQWLKRKTKNNRKKIKRKKAKNGKR